MRPWALVPIKPPALSKQRLAGVLSPASREALTLAMAHDVLTALAAVNSLAGIAIITADGAASALSRRFGARIIDETEPSGYRGAVASATRLLASEGVASLLLLPLDVPLVRPSDIEHVIAAHDRRAPAVTIVPAHDGIGTNCVLRSPPDSVALSFEANSFAAHLRAARAAGIAPTVLDLPRIGLDIDQPDDLDRLRRTGGGTSTHRLLDSFGLPDSFASPRRTATPNALEGVAQ